MTHAIQYMRLDVHGWISGTNIVNCNPLHEAGYSKQALTNAIKYMAGYSKQALSNAIQYMRLDIQNKNCQMQSGTWLDIQIKHLTNAIQYMRLDIQNKHCQMRSST